MSYFCVSAKETAPVRPQISAMICFYCTSLCLVLSSLHSPHPCPSVFLRTAFLFITPVSHPAKFSSLHFILSLGTWLSLLYCCACLPPFLCLPPRDDSKSSSHRTTLISSLSIPNHLFIDFYLSSHPSFPSLQAFRVNDTDRCSLHPFSKLSHTINSFCTQQSTSHLPPSSSLAHRGTHRQTHTHTHTHTHKHAHTA